MNSRLKQITGGEKGIPEERIQQIAKHEWIGELCGQFAEKFRK